VPVAALPFIIGCCAASPSVEVSVVVNGSWVKVSAIYLDNIFAVEGLDWLKNLRRCWRVWKGSCILFFLFFKDRAAKLVNSTIFCEC
jgi:hypothetical protein